MAKKSKKNIIVQLSTAPKAILQFIMEAKDELKKVSWPSRQTTTRYTVIVVVASIAVGIGIGAIDYIFSLALESVI